MPFLLCNLPLAQFDFITERVFIYEGSSERYDSREAYENHI